MTEAESEEEGSSVYQATNGVMFDFAAVVVCDPGARDGVTGAGERNGIRFDLATGDSIFIRDDHGAQEAYDAYRFYARLADQVTTEEDDETSIES
jgi:hypothetical protein